MDRLTGRNEFSEVTSYNPETDHVAGDREIRDRLAEYEDIGLSPEQIFQVIDRAKKAEADCSDMIKALQVQLIVVTEEIDGLKKCEEINRRLYIYLRERLAAYEDSELAPEDFKQLVESKATEHENIELRKEIAEVNLYHHKLSEVIARNLVAWDTSKDKSQGLLPEVYLTNKQVYRKLVGEEYEFKRACDLFHIGDDWSCT